MVTSTSKNLPTPPASIGITSVSDPFSVIRQLAIVPQGWTIVDILRHLKVGERLWPHTVVLFDGTTMCREYWSRVRPRPGVRVVVRVLPAGGGNDFLRTFLLVAVAVVAVSAAPYAVGLVGSSLGISAATAYAAVPFAQAAIFAAGALAVNSLVPPSTPKYDSPGQSSPTLSVLASQNALKPFSPMPVILGKHRFYPPYAAKPYTELVGKDQYLRLLFVVGYKDLQISELKIGETLLSNYESVEYEILCGGTSDLDHDGNPVTAITLFTESIDEINPDQKLTGPGAPVEQTTELDTDEFSLDLTFPNGLIRIDRSGDKKPIEVTVIVEYKLTDGGSYSTVDTVVTRATSPETIRKGVRFKFPARDQYTVRVTRTTDDVPDANGDDQTYQDDVYLTAFRSIVNENPVNHADAALIALRIKATDQLNGTVANFNCVASSILPDYDTSLKTWVSRETNNPASLFRAVLEGKANARPLLPISKQTWLDGTSITKSDSESVVLRDIISNSRSDLDALSEWHTECADAGRTFNMVRDFQSTVWDTLHDIASAGRGRVRHINGLWSVVRDLPQTTPRQHFTPRNSWGFAAAKNYIVRPHAFRVRFINEDQGWENDERLVYDDGYDASNATRFETLELTGVTNPDQIWSMARYHIAVARLRPEVFTFQTDIEHIAVTQGDVIRFMHDAILVGLGAARISAVNATATEVTSIELDASVPMDGTSDYAVRIRDSDTGIASLYTVDPIVGETNELTFTTPIPIESAPSVGSLVMFGESGLDTMDLIVDSIVPGPDLSATLKCYDAAPGVLIADQGDIPAFDSHITQPPGAVRPVIEQAISDESVLLRAADGTLQVRIMLSFGFLNNRASVEYILVQYKQSITAEWRSIPILDGDALSASIYEVTEGLTYDIRARYKFLDQTLGEWSNTLQHTVVGKTAKPPDVDTLLVRRLSDGTREFTWTLNNPPIDMAGFRLKYRDGASGADWDTNMTDLLDGPAIRKKPADGLVTASPWETFALAAGTYSFAIKAVDTGGRESENAKFVISTLGDPRIGNALLEQDEFRNGWPGTKSACFVDPDSGYLSPNSADDWSTGPATWSAWTVWNSNPVATMYYFTLVIDIGASVLYTPLVTTLIDSGSVTVDERHGDVTPPDGSWTSYTAIGPSITSRYVQFRLTVNNPDVLGLQRCLIILSADTIEEEVRDLDTSTLTPEAGGGVKIPVNKSFSLITTVQVALQNVTYGHSWVLISKSDTVNGPHIRIYNASGTQVYPVIDAVIKGL